jgi:hypothetical protein
VVCRDRFQADRACLRRDARLAWLARSPPRLTSRYRFAQQLSLCPAVLPARSLTPQAECSVAALATAPKSRLRLVEEARVAAWMGVALAPTA